MKNRLLSIFLALALCLTLLPTAALADVDQGDDPTQAGGSIGSLTGDGITYMNWVDGVFENTTHIGGSVVVASEENVTWSGWYVVKDNVTIGGTVTVNGNVNLILCDGKELKIDGGINKSSTGQLTVYGQTNGTGKLTVTGAVDLSGIKTGMYIECLTVNGGEVSVTCDDNNAYQPNANSGIYLTGINDALTVRGGKLTATGGKMPCGGYSRGIYNNGVGALTVTGGELIATGGMVGKPDASDVDPLTGYNDPDYVGYEGKSYGIFNTGGSITVSGGKLTATGGSVEVSSGSAISCGIYSSSVTVTGGEVNATGDSAKRYNYSSPSDVLGSYGIWLPTNNGGQAIAVSGGTVNVTSGTAVNKGEIGSAGESCAVFAEQKAITVTGGTVNTQTGNVTAEYPSVFDISTYGDLTITGGTVQKKGTTGGAVVVSGQNVTVTGGTIKLAAGSNAGKFAAPSFEALNALVDTGCAYYEEYWDSEAELDVKKQLDGKALGYEYEPDRCKISNSMENSWIYVRTVGPNDRQPVSYLDAQGKTQTCVLYEVLDSKYVDDNTGEYGFWVGSGERTGDRNWLVVKSDLTINSKMNVGAYANLHLILCDNTKLTVAGISGDNSNKITIYGQSGGTGKLVSTDTSSEDGCGISASDGLTINGGVIEASAQSGYSIYAYPSLTVNGGTMKLKESDLSNSVTVSNGVKFKDLLAEGYAYWQEGGETGSFLKLADLEDATKLEAENTNYYIKACEYTTTSGVCEYCGKDFNPAPTPSTPSGGLVVIPSGGTSGSTSGEKEEPLPFVDVKESDWFSEAVRWAVGQKITDGVEANYFGAGLSCTRAQLVTFLWRAAGSPVVNYAMDFTDVDAGAYYGEAVRWASSLGIVSGYGNALFGTNDPITREQMVVMLYRFAVAMGYDVSVGAETSILGYSDASKIADYAVEAFRWAVGAGIVQGADGKLMPQESCTRGQIVTMLYRMFAKKL